MSFIYLEITPERAMNGLGFSEIREQQVGPIHALIDRRDTLAVIPTGGGKSAIFQSVALIWAPRLSLSVTPLKSLQDDQVAALRAKGINARLLNSSLSASERAELLEDIRKGRVTILYLAPEQFQNSEIRALLKEVGIAMIVLDEAHCAVDSFRKAYSQIGDFIAELENRPVIAAFTATATKRDRKAIIKGLGMENPAVFVEPIRRENLHLSIKRVNCTEKTGKKEKIWREKRRIVESSLKDWNGKGSVIIYCPTVRDVKRLYKWLKSKNWKVGKYHGKMTDRKRIAAQEAFLSGETPIMVATNAFGLGIDKPDVRLVVHAGLPLSIDGYVQEVGRAGRDGRKAKCVLIYAPSDVSANKAVLSHGAKEKERGRTIARLDALSKLVRSEKCLWRGIEKYFGEKPGEKCGSCCNCEAKKYKKN